MYTLTKSKDDFQYKFNVVANNIEAFWNTRVAVTKEVYVYLDFGDDGLWVSILISCI